MRFALTKEMNELEKIYKPYKKGCHLVPNAPKEAIEAFEKHKELFKKEYEKNSRIDLL